MRSQNVDAISTNFGKDPENETGRRFRIKSDLTVGS